MIPDKSSAGGVFKHALAGLVEQSSGAQLAPSMIRRVQAPDLGMKMFFAFMGLVSIGIESLEWGSVGGPHTGFGLVGLIFFGLWLWDHLKEKAQESVSATEAKARRRLAAVRYLPADTSEPLPLGAVEAMTRLANEYLALALPTPTYRARAAAYPTACRVTSTRGPFAGLRVEMGEIGTSGYGVRSYRFSRALRIANTALVCVVVLIFISRLVRLSDSPAASDLEQGLTVIGVLLGILVVPFWIVIFIATRVGVNRWYPAALQSRLSVDMLTVFENSCTLGEPATSDDFTVVPPNLDASARQVSEELTPICERNERQRRHKRRFYAVLLVVLALGIACLVGYIRLEAAREEARWLAYTRDDALKFLHDRDYASADRILRRLAPGDPEAAYALGVSREEQRDSGEAFKWYKEAAEQGVAAAQYQVGFSLLQDEETQRGIAWLEKAAKQGNHPAETQLGMVYDGWTGVPRDEKRAMELYSKAAIAGDDIAQGNLSSLLNGRRQYAEAYKMVRLCELWNGPKISAIGVVGLGSAERACPTATADLLGKLSKSTIAAIDREVHDFISRKATSEPDLMPRG